MRKQPGCHLRALFMKASKGEPKAIESGLGCRSSVSRATHAALALTSDDAVYA